MLKISTLSIFPDIFSCLNYGIPGRAQKDCVDIEHKNLADYASRKDRRIDDRPFGGGAGMIMQADVLDKALTSLYSTETRLIIPDPKGKAFTQKDAKRLSLYPHLLFLCGRYEGIDQRILDKHPHESFSIFDAVCSGGEIPAALMIDTIIRELDTALGNPLSLQEDSFQDNMLDHPHFTRPWDWQSLTPPAILSSGHHANIMRWRRQHMLGTTWMHRPELLFGRNLSPEDIKDFIVFLTEQELSYERDPTDRI